MLIEKCSFQVSCQFNAFDWLIMINVLATPIRVPCKAFVC